MKLATESIVLHSRTKQFRLLLVPILLFLLIELTNAKQKVDFQKCKPRHVHLTVGQDASTSMMVSFSSSSSHEECRSASAVVIVGTDPDALDMTFEETEPARQYTFNYQPVSSDGGNDGPPTVYTSDLLHHISVEGLKPSEKYYYQCVIIVNQEEDGKEEMPMLKFDNNNFVLPLDESRRALLLTKDDIEHNKQTHMKSALSSFHTAPPPGEGLGSLKFALVGDVGTSEKAHATISHLQAEHIHRGSPISSIVHVGDISYSDGVQTKWDYFMTMAEPLLNTVPMQVCAGNHEIERDASTREIFVPYDARFAMPQIKAVEKSPVPYSRHHKKDSIHRGENLPYEYGNAFYAYTYGAARFIMLSSFSRTDVDSSQYQFFKEELESVDRSITPWVFVACHVPLYNTFQAHQKDPMGKEMMESMEHLFIKHNVNIVFSGHVHAYMRSKPIAKYRVDTAGPTYIIIGDGGQDSNGSKYQRKEPEDWVETRDERVKGFGTIKLLNETHAHWRWVRNANERFSTVHDHVLLENQYFS